eukprot:TRINITY_DN20414_c0_g1_i1.p1 TRINITY_DN20414_c0_g1~~TRINITY_DN20414_c0_g1_i1.p1  ORF type:complete len:198 (-),score=11.07 TRINITY_DN20414_c0_g1_i1:88-681(-)
MRLFQERHLVALSVGMRSAQIQDSSCTRRWHPHALPQTTPHKPQSSDALEDMSRRLQNVAIETQVLAHGDILRPSKASAHIRDQAYSSDLVVTHGVLDLLSLFWRHLRTVGNDEPINELCLGGSTGCGKSCALRILQADIRRRLPDHPVCYVRETNTHWVAPVSYTHLRAHETVLDLVCRLLLEKKKKTMKIKTIHV